MSAPASPALIDRQRAAEALLAACTAFHRPADVPEPSRPKPRKRKSA